jgi:hypothetical protein
MINVPDIYYFPILPVQLKVDSFARSLLFAPALREQIITLHGA